MARRNPRATTPAAAMYVAMLAFMLAAAPVEAKDCRSSDVLPAGANISSPSLVVDLEGCTALSLTSNNIGDRGAAAIAEALKSNTELTSLHLGYNTIGPSGAAALAEALKSNTALTKLWLHDNKIGDSGSVAIAEALKSNTVLTELRLDSNNIGDSGAVAIAEALKSNTALTWLDLNSNDIGDIGATAIAEALKNNTALTYLYLYNNAIGDIGATAIAEALKNNTALTHLYLYYNTIGDSGAAALAEALKGNTALTSLYLHGNDIGDSGAAALAEMLEINTALTELWLRSNNIGDSGAAALVEALKNNAALTRLWLHNNNLTCSNHGTQRTGTINIAAGRRICKCSGLWSGTVCHTDVPGKTAITVVFSVAAVAALVWFMVVVVNPKCIRPFRARKQAERQRKQEERAFGIAHPINVTTVGGNAYTLEDWGHCKDLKLALKKLAPPGELGDPSTFELLDNDGWTAPPSGGGDADETAAEVDTKYGSVHRATMMQSALDGDIKLTLVYKATGGGGVLPACTLREDAAPAGGVTMKKVQQSDV